MWLLSRAGPSSLLLTPVICICLIRCLLTAVPGSLSHGSVAFFVSMRTGTMDSSRNSVLRSLFSRNSTKHPQFYPKKDNFEIFPIKISQLTYFLERQTSISEHRIYRARLGLWLCTTSMFQFLHLLNGGYNITNFVKLLWVQWELNKSKMFWKLLHTVSTYAAAAAKLLKVLAISGGSIVLTSAVIIT